MAFVPRQLIDDVEDRFVDECGAEVQAVRNRLETVDKEIKELNGKLTNARNKINDPNLTDTDRKKCKDEEASFALQLSQKKLKKEDMKKWLPKFFSDMKQAAIEKRRHRWGWILEKKSKEDEDVESIMNQIQKRYQMKDEDYRKKVTLEKFIDKFCLALAKAHDRGSVVAAHAIKKMEIEDGYEFEHVYCYGEEDIDEYLTMLINAVGLRKVKPLKDGQRYSLRKLL